VSELALEPGARVLDFGCGDQPYRAIFGTDVDYIAADLPGNPDADIVIDGGRVGLPDESVDLVFSSQVLEHVADPGAYLAECRRVLRPGGTLLLSTHGVMFHHPHPTDFWRWTTEGLASVVDDSGLRLNSLTPLMGAVPLGLWLLMLNIQAKLPQGIRHGFVSVLNLLIAWSDRREWPRYRADFVYVVNAQRH
jgi:SAM-dependent methyltransferase